MDLGLITIIVMAVVVNLVLFTMFISMFKKCPPNTAIIVSGALSREPKIVIGGGTVVFPLIEECRFLSLEVMSIKTRLETPIYTKDGAEIFVDAITLAKMGGDDAAIRVAAENFLNKSADEVASIVNTIVAAQISKIASTITLADLLSHIEGLRIRVMELAALESQKLGLSILSFTIQEIHHTSKIKTELEKYTDAENKQNSYIAGDLAK